jgi:hypothetical protein
MPNLSNNRFTMDKSNICFTAAFILPIICHVITAILRAW